MVSGISLVLGPGTKILTFVWSSGPLGGWPPFWLAAPLAQGLSLTAKISHHPELLVPQSPGHALRILAPCCRAGSAAQIRWCGDSVAVAQVSKGALQPTEAVNARVLTRFAKKRAILLCGLQLYVVGITSMHGLSVPRMARKSIQRGACPALLACVSTPLLVLFQHSIRFMDRWSCKTFLQSSGLVSARALKFKDLPRALFTYLQSRGL